MKKEIEMKEYEPMPRKEFLERALKLLKPNNIPFTDDDDDEDAEIKMRKSRKPVMSISWADIELHDDWNDKELWIVELIPQEDEDGKIYPEDGNSICLPVRFNDFNEWSGDCWVPSPAKKAFDKFLIELFKEKIQKELAEIDLKPKKKGKKK